MGSDQSVSVEKATKAASSKSTLKERIEMASKTNRLQLSNQTYPKPMTEIPLEVYTLASLVSLDLSDNQIGPTIPSEFFAKLKNLQTLKLSGNKLQYLPETMSDLNSLRTLDLSRNYLSSLELGLPRKQLITIDLSHNQFKGDVGHPELALPPSVITVNLSHNLITGFGVFGFEMLEKLEELDLSHNKITSIPSEIGLCVRLQCIKLEFNQLKTLPKELLEKTRVNRISLEGNPMTKEDLLAIEGIEAFIERRKARITKEMHGGLKTDRDFCGLD